MSGLGNQGFTPKSFEEILDSKQQAYIAAFGDVNLLPESVNGQIININAVELVQLWQLALGVYNSQFTNTALGISLDYACDNLGLTRLAATATLVIAELTGVSLTTVLDGSDVAIVGNDTVFKLTEDVLLTNSACIQSYLTIENNTELSYTVNINGTPYEYITFITDDTPEITDSLIFLINQASIGVTASLSGLSSIKLRSDDNTDFSVIVSAGIIIDSVTNYGTFKSSIDGFLPVPANTLNTIITPIPGWLEVNNPLAGDTGRNIETDTELRLRKTQSLRISGTGTVEAIRANLRNISGVIVADVIENKTMNTVDGIPAKSFKCIVLGGDDDEIALTIWKKKPAGIQAFGDIDITIQDSEGFDQIIGFSRPTPIYIFVEVVLTLDSTNTYPINGEDIISNGILNIIKTLNVGDDVIYQSFYQAVYSVSGIQSAIITIGGTTNESVAPTLSSANVVVGASEAAVSDLSKILVGF